jgi:hypothetical protein
MFEGTESPPPDLGSGLPPAIVGVMADVMSAAVAAMIMIELRVMILCSCSTENPVRDIRYQSQRLSYVTMVTSRSERGQKLRLWNE